MRIGERSREIRCGRQNGLGSYWAFTSEVVACLLAVLEKRRRHCKEGGRLAIIRKLTRTSVHVADRNNYLQLVLFVVKKFS